MRFSPLALFATLSLAAGPRPAAASETQSEAATAEDAAKARARSLYEQGARSYSEGRYYEAADLFVSANRVYPSPDLVFNVAKAYDKLGNQSGALAFYREYLRQAGAAPDEAAAARAKELELLLAQRGVQQLTVLSDPAGALLLIDGKPVGLTPWTGETWPGQHRVVLELREHQPFETVVALTAHRSEDLTVKLAPLPPPTGTKPNPKTEAKEKQPAVSALTWIALGAGTAALGAALAVEMSNDDRGGLSRTGAFFGGAGVAACALGGVLLYVDLSPATSRPRSAALPPRLAIGLRTSF